MAQGMAFLNVWFGDGVGDAEYGVANTFMAVYAAGGGKRNMVNFARPPGHAAFQPADIFVHVSEPTPSPLPCQTQLFICRLVHDL